MTIGDNCIVGAGSVVTKNIPENCVAAGNPAKVIARTDEYIARIKTINRNKKIFDKSYYIDKLDENKRCEILSSVADGIGFIV